MNGAHIHLLLNHVPLLAIFFGLVLLAYGLFSRKALVQNIALIFFVFAGLVTIPVMLSGEDAEEIAENIPAVTEATIEPHEEAAEFSAYAAGILGAVSLLYLVIKVIYHRNYPAALSIILVAGIVAFGMMFRTAQLGGLIIHKEIEGGAAAIQAPSETTETGNQPQQENNENEDDEDE